MKYPNASSAKGGGGTNMARNPAPAGNGGHKGTMGNGTCNHRASGTMGSMSGNPQAKGVQGRG